MNVDTAPPFDWWYLGGGLVLGLVALGVVLVARRRERRRRRP